MKIRITRPAGRQIDHVLTYIGGFSPQGRRRVSERIDEVFNILVDYPFAGQTTRKRGVRRIIVSPYPYAITYRLAGEEVLILGLRHTARRPLL